MLLRVGCLAVAPNVRERWQILKDGDTLIEVELPNDVMDQAVPIVGYNVVMPYRRIQ